MEFYTCRHRTHTTGFSSPKKKKKKFAKKKSGVLQPGVTYSKLRICGKCLVLEPAVNTAEGMNVRMEVFCWLYTLGMSTYTWCCAVCVASTPCHTWWHLWHDCVYNSRFLSSKQLVAGYTMSGSLCGYLNQAYKKRCQSCQQAAMNVLVWVIFFFGNSSLTNKHWCFCLSI